MPINGVERAWRRVLPSFMKVKRTRYDGLVRRVLRDDRAVVWFHEGSRHWFVSVLARRGGEPGFATAYPLNQDPLMEDGPLMTHADVEDLAWNWFHADGRDQRAHVERRAEEHRAAEDRRADRFEDQTERLQREGERRMSRHPFWRRQLTKRYRRQF